MEITEALNRKPAITITEGPRAIVGTVRITGNRLLLLIQELDPVCFDLDDRARCRIVTVPRPALQFAFDEHRTPLA